MNIRLISLSIANFKGIKNLTIEPNGRSYNIYGDNATGKTTVYDSLMWLLFDRDSAENTKFDIKPLDSEGNVLSSGSVSEVSATLNVDGEEIEFTKNYYEKWSQKRGSIDKTFDGNTSDYYVDRVPVKKKEYDERIEEIISRDTFKLLTNVTYFADVLDWQKRREILFDICAMPDDGVIMDTDDKFGELKVAVGRGTVADLKKKLAAKRTGLSEMRAKAPGKIETLEKAAEPYRELDYDALNAEADALQKDRDATAAEIARIKDGKEALTIRAEIAELNSNLSRLNAENTEYQATQLAAATTGGESKALEAEVGHLTTQIDLVNKQAQDAEEWLAKLRQEWEAEAGREWDGETACPTCGREYDAENIDAAKKAFTAQKNERLLHIEKQAKTLKNQHNEHIKILTALESDKRAKLEQLEVLKASDPVGETPIKDMDGYEEKRKHITSKIDVLRAELDAGEKKKKAKLDALKKKVTDADIAGRALSAKLAGREFVARCEAQIEDIRQEAKEASAEMESIDKLIFLCEEFIRYKVSFVTDAVNDKFELARFKLFNVQVNGGISECCDVTYNGIRYGSNLNSGAKICVGIDIIDTLSKAFGVSVPLFVDNAESVTQIYPIDTQVIRLIVSEQDKTLRCEAA